MHYAPKDLTCIRCGCAPDAHLQYRDGKPPHCPAERPSDLYELRANGHVFKAPTYEAIDFTNCDKCGEQFGARGVRLCPVH
jgi:hypothetical protein